MVKNLQTSTIKAKCFVKFVIFKMNKNNKKPPRKPALKVKNNQLGCQIEINDIETFVASIGQP